MAARFSPRLPVGMGGGLALECKTFGEAADQLAQAVVGEVLVITFVLAGEQDMHGVVEVVVPLAVVERDVPVLPPMQMDNISVVLGGQVNVPVRKLLADL